jgi:predicted secreted protein
VQTFEDSSQAIHVAAGEAFAIRLAGNPTTGYAWQAKVEPQYLELVAQEYQLRGEGAGAGGYELFRFCALEAGRTGISLEYRRPWETAARDKAYFQVHIS